MLTRVDQLERKDLEPILHKNSLYINIRYKWDPNTNHILYTITRTRQKNNAQILAMANNSNKNVKITFIDVIELYINVKITLTECANICHVFTDLV